MPRGGRGCGGRGNPSNRNLVFGYDASHSAPVDAPEGAMECLICAEPVRAFCVFSCGHHTCYSCGLRIHSINGGGCPVCRVKGGKQPIITRYISQDEEQYSSSEMDTIRHTAIADRKLKCVIDGAELASEVAKLYENMCPMECCWQQGQQDPFYEFDSLRDHMRIDHKLAFCTICIENRSAFLCEQTVYGEEALNQHLSGLCPYDSASFTGHPPCKFCSRRDNAVRFYDGEALLKHMQQRHFTCDVCNKGQYTFTFYDSRHKLNQHFERCHKICDHPDCQGLDLMLRVFVNDFDLAVHRQRVHGVKAKLVLTQSSFVHSDEASGGSSAAPATGSNTNVIQITFDHVFHRETVEMLPTKASVMGRQKNRHHKHGSNGGAKEQVFAPEENGLPPYYYRAGVMDILTRNAVTAATDSDRNSGGTSSSTLQGSRGKGDRHVDPSSPNSPGPTHAFGISETMETYNVKNKVPTDPKEQERQLNEMLSRVLTSPVAYAHFRRTTKEFIDSAILTSQYYDVLSKEIFPDKTVFRSVFPLLVATVPNANKKMALQEVWKMRMAPEQQRLARAQEEDERAREAEEAKEAKARQAAMWNDKLFGKGSGGGGGAGKKNGRNTGSPKPNAWRDQGKVAKLQSGSPTSHGPGATSDCRVNSLSPSPQPTAGNNNNNNNSGGSWAGHVATASPSSRGGGATSSISVWGDTANSGNSGGGASANQSNVAPASSSTISQPLGAALGSEELFPALPDNSVRGGRGWAQHQKKKAAAKTPNAWFQKN